MKSLAQYIKEEIESQKYTVTVKDKNGKIDTKNTTVFDDPKKAQQHYDKMTKQAKGSGNNVEMSTTC